MNDRRFLRTTAFLIAAMASLTLAMAQADRPSSSSEFMGDRMGISGSQFVQSKGLALESTIDPESYFVGPSDVFSINVWISPPVNFILTVTPEGTLIIPTVKEVFVAHLTLAEAKRAIVQEIRKKYIIGEPSVTLVSPRSIVVTVTGNVLNPSSYVLGSFNRADKAIEEANKPQRSQTQYESQQVMNTMSQRNVRITHRDGTVSRVDIKKFFATKEDKWNPYLREGDVIIVPRNDFRKNIVAIYGEVNVPGRYEFIEGDSLKDLLRIAYGFTPLAMNDSVELSRLNIRANEMSAQVFDGLAILNGTNHDVALEPGDRIVVRARPDLRADYKVRVSGEVVYPGLYPITKYNTYLTEIIGKAGGFTGFASLRTSEVIRRSVNPAQIELERLESLRGSVTPEDSAYYYLETNLRIQKEVVSVDFVRLFNEQDISQDILLQDGDEIVISSIRRTIYVFGQVVAPGNTPFVPGASAEYYIEKSGGFTERARTGDVRIVKARTRQWLDPGETVIEEGDYVWVPKKTEYSFSYYMNIIGQTASIVSVAVSVVLLVLQLNK